MVLPTNEFFPPVVSSGQSAAEETFEQVKKYAGMEKWPAHLMAQEEDPSFLVAPTLVVRNVEQNPLGTFSANESNEVVLTYNPKIVADPIQMVTTFAHELPHYLTGTVCAPSPGGWENWEFATDIGATFLGFGVFEANAAFNFQQYASVDSIGWQTSGGGYLTEAEHSYALALFLRLKGIPAETALPFCDTNIRGYVKRALKELDSNGVINELRAVACGPCSSQQAGLSGPESRPRKPDYHSTS